jgi:hypothetical protein
MLIRRIDNQPPGSEIIASGTSCRHQIVDLSNVRPKHMVELSRMRSHDYGGVGVGVELR